MAQIIIESWSNTLVPKRSVHEFTYDESEYSFSDDALRHIEGLMGTQNAFSVSFQTEQTEVRATLVNDILWRVSGRDAGEHPST